MEIFNRLVQPNLTTVYIRARAHTDTHARTHNHTHKITHTKSHTHTRDQIRTTSTQ